MGFNTSSVKKALDCCLSSKRDCKSCPFREDPILGSCKDDLKFVVDNLCDFYDMFYVPGYAMGGRVRRSLSKFRRLSKIIDNIDFYYSEEV